MNFAFKNAEEYYDTLFQSPNVKKMLSVVTDSELLAQIKVEVLAEYDKRMGEGVLDPKSFEVMIITAEKAK